MGWLRPALVALLGLVIAPAAGLVALPVFVLLDPVTRDTSLALADFVLLRLAEATSEAAAAEEAEAFFAFLYAAVLAIAFFPVVLTASVGALARIRSWIFYAVATGAITAAMPWILRSAYHLPRASAVNPAEMRFALVFFLTGIVIGSAYWCISAAFGNARGKVAA